MVGFSAFLLANLHGSTLPWNCGLYLVHVDVFFGGFDNNNDVCDKEFDWMVILVGRVFGVVEEEVYAIIKNVSLNKFDVLYC